MIAQIRGTVAGKDGDRVVVMTAAGVAYEISLPAGVLGRVPAVGQEVHLHTVVAVREDDWSLYGFDQASDRGVFQRLLQANGVGPRLALAMMSALGGDRVVRAVRDGDLAALCTVSGVGKKKAERMVLELKEAISVRPGTAEGNRGRSRGVYHRLAGAFRAPERPEAAPPDGREAAGLG